MSTMGTFRGWKDAPGDEIERLRSKLANMEHEAEQITRRYAAYVSPEEHQAKLAEAKREDPAGWVRGSEHDALVAYAGALVAAIDVFFSDFNVAADYDKEHGGCYLITRDRFESIRAKLRAVENQMNSTDGSTEGRASAIEVPATRNHRPKGSPQAHTGESGGGAPAGPSGESAMPAAGVEPRPSVEFPASRLPDATAIRNAVLSCGHYINAEIVTLRYDPRQPGHNALNQLHRRICALIGEEFAETLAVCKDFAPGADPSRCLYCGVNVESHVTSSADEIQK